MADKKYIRFQDLSDIVDIGAVEIKARKDWEKQQRRQRRLEQWMMRGMPFGLLVMAIVFYLLSAQHTAMIVNMITPGWGWVAPVGFELGIVIIAAIREAKWRTWLTQSVMLGLIGMSIIVNVAGGFLSVVEFGTQQSVAVTVDATNSTAVAGLTMLALLEKFGTLPAVYQVALLIVVPFGVAIPVLASMVGESLVKLALGRIRLETDDDNARWLNEMGRVMYNALLQAALKAGAGAGTAAKWAKAVTSGMSDYEPLTDARGQKQIPASTQVAGALGFLGIPGQKALPRTVPGQSQTMFVSQSVPAAGASDAQNDRQDSPTETVRVRKDDVIAWLRSRDDWRHLSDRDAARLYMQARFGIDSDSAYKTIQRARKEV